MSVSSRVVISNEAGLHARPSNAFTTLAGRFESRITVVRCDTQATADGRSTLGLLTLAACHGTELEIRASGPDAEAAVAALVDLVRGGFNAGESRP